MANQKTALNIPEEFSQNLEDRRGAKGVPGVSGEIFPESFGFDAFGLPAEDDPGEYGFGPIAPSSFGFGPHGTAVHLDGMSVGSCSSTCKQT